jgi:hypothetical protein
MSPPVLLRASPFPAEHLQPLGSHDIVMSWHTLQALSARVDVLIDAQQNSRLASADLDVFAHEPQVPTAYRLCPTPH